LKLEKNNLSHTLEYQQIKIKISALDHEIYSLNSELQSFIAEKQRELQNVNSDSIEVDLPSLPQNEKLAQVVANHLKEQNMKTPKELKNLISQYLDLHTTLHDLK